MVYNHLLGCLYEPLPGVEDAAEAVGGKFSVERGEEVGIDFHAVGQRGLSELHFNLLRTDAEAVEYRFHSLDAMAAYHSFYGYVSHMIG